MYFCCSNWDPSFSCGVFLIFAGSILETEAPSPDYNENASGPGSSSGEDLH